MTKMTPSKLREHVAAQRRRLRKEIVDKLKVTIADPGYLDVVDLDVVDLAEYLADAAETWAALDRLAFSADRMTK